MVPDRSEFLNDVLLGLKSQPKELHCKYFYDERGARLFAEICALDEYYPTRTEVAILRRCAAELGRLLGRCTLIEYGSGAGIKTRLLLDHLPEASYVPVDISQHQLDETARAVAAEYRIPVHPLCADFTKGLRLPSRTEPAKRVVFFPGSTIGNFAPTEATCLLRGIAELAGRGGGLVLGIDLKKDPRVLHAAYNDSAGVTARFNLNLLHRINRELDANFDPEQFWHWAYYQPVDGRIEMHLVSRRAQEVCVGDVPVRFEEGESVRTECSYKYTIEGVRSMAAAAGLVLQESWIDDLGYFAVAHFLVG